jgi:hypothetical protein
MKNIYRNGSCIRPSERITPLISSSVGLTASSPASSEPDAGKDGKAHLLLTGDHKNIFPSLSRKLIPNGTINMKISIRVGGVQNRQFRCYRSMPFLVLIRATHPSVEEVGSVQPNADMAESTGMVQQDESPSF